MVVLSHVFSLLKEVEGLVLDLFVLGARRGERPRRVRTAQQLLLGRRQQPRAVQDYGGVREVQLLWVARLQPLLLRLRFYDYAWAERFYFLGFDVVAVDFAKLESLLILTGNRSCIATVRLCRLFSVNVRLLAQE